MSVAVRVCPSAHTGCPWLTISTHISTLVLGLSTLSLPVDCSGDFGPLELSVHYTQDVRGCPSAHTGCPCVSVSTHRTSVAVRVCPCVSGSTHTTSVAVHQYTYQHGNPWTQHADPSRGLFGTSMAVRVCLCVSVSTHKTSVAVHHAHMTSVGVRQHTHDVRGCPWLAHTGRPWLSVCVRVCPSAQTGRLWVSVSTHRTTLVLGLSTLTLPVDCSGDFGPRGVSVQYIQEVRGCPPAHIGCPWLSGAVRQHTQDFCGCPCVSVSTHRTSVAVYQYTYQHAGPSRGLFGTSVAVCGCPSAHTGRQWLSVCVRVCPSAHTGRPWLSISTHISTLVLGLSTLDLPVDCLGDFGPRELSVQYTKVVRGCPSAHTRRPWLPVCVRQHTQDVRGFPSVHISARWSMDSARWPLPWTVGVILAHVGCLFSTHRTSVVWVCQHREDVCGFPSAHTGRPCVSVSTHRMSVAVCVCPSAHTGCLWLSISTHISTLVLGLGMLALPVDCLGDFGPRGLSVQYTQDVRGTHKMSVAVHKYTYEHAGPWTQHGGPSRGLFGTSVCVRQHTQDMRGCPCVSVSTHRTSVAVHQYTYQHIGLWTQPADPSRGLFGTSVAVRVCPSVSVSTHRTSVAVCGCPSAHTGRQWLSVCVRVCPSAHTGRPWLSISTHISTLVLGLSTLALPVECSGDFGPRELSVQYTKVVRGCPSAHTRRPWLPVCVRQHTQDVRGFPSVHISALHTGRLWVSASTQDICGCPWLAHTGRPWLSVCVRVCLSAQTRRLWVSVSTHRTSVCVRQHTQDVCGCLCVSVSTHRTSVAVHQYTYQHVGPWTQHAGPSRGLFG
ncbi:hypothetical protein YC2023_066217 [Brassica napus]